MSSYEFKESDWKKFREKVSDWQERYMEKLSKEYIAILLEDTNASDRFWKLEERINEDKNKRGVVIQKSRSKMLFNLYELLDEGVITLKDLSDFSDELNDLMRAYCGR